MDNIRNVKSLLAKLMATENLDVVFGNFQTASFDTQNRILRMPNFEAAESVQDLFVCHEVSHALNTPAEGLHDVLASGVTQAFKTILNVIEDARIERLIQKKYPGARKRMIEGYRELLKMDFFGLQKLQTEVQDLPLIDRINLYTKCGMIGDFQFTKEEFEFVNRALTTNTWEEVVQLSREISDYMKENEQDKFRNTPDHRDGDGDDDDFDFGPDTFESSQEDGEDDHEDQKGGTHERPQEDAGVDGSGEASEGDTDEDGSEEEGSEGDSGLDQELGDLDTETEVEPRSLTDELYQQASAEMTSNQSANITIELPSFDRSNHWDYKKVLQEWSELDKEMDDEYREYSLELYKKFQTESKASISYLLKEFEMKKSATEMNRSRQAKTGLIDMSKLYKAKITDDIFLQQTIVNSSKNHSMVFLIDWSRSMVKYIHETVRQLIVLTTFCRKANIPFEVLAFTGLHEALHPKIGRINYGQIDSDNIVRIGTHDVAHVNFLSSRASAAEYDKLCYGLFYQSRVMSSEYRYDFAQAYLNAKPGANLYGFKFPRSYAFELYNTPLNSSLAQMPDYITSYRKKTGAEVCNFIVLSDGDSHDWTPVNQEGNLIYEHSALPEGMSSRKCARTIYDPKTKTSVKIMGRDRYRSASTITEGMIQLIRSACEVNTMGFFITKTLKYYAYELSLHLGQDEIRRQMKTKVVDCPVRGYDRHLFIMSSLVTEDESDMEDVRGAAKGKIKNAFIKSMKSKSTNKVFLSKFVETIAGNL